MLRQANFSGGELARSWTRRVGWPLGVALLYVVAAHLGLSLSFERTNATPVWPASGIALAALLVLGTRLWPGILVGAFVTNLLQFAQNPNVAAIATVGGALLVAAGNTAEALAGVYLVEHFVGDSRPFQSVVRTIRFVGMALLVAVIGASVGVTTMLSASAAPVQDSGLLWVTWWLGDAVGILIFTPLLLSWSQRVPERRSPTRMIEAGLLVFAVVPTGVLLFGRALTEHITYSLPYLAMPLVLWTAFRLGLREATAGVAMVSAVSIWGTITGQGPFHSASLNESLLMVQSFSGTVAITVLTIAAALQERGRLYGELQEVNRTLEERISKRTSELAAANEVLCEEIRTRCKAEEMIKHMANHDSLTGLANRRLVEDLFQSMEAWARRDGHWMAILFLDLDDFKPINDELGHRAGDEALRVVAERLTASVRESDLVARFGGDEFVVVLPKITNARDAVLVARKVIDGLSRPFWVAGQRRFLGASVGISVYPRDGSDLDRLLRCADQAMYGVKVRSKNRFAFYQCDRERQASSQRRREDGAAQS